MKITQWIMLLSICISGGCSDGWVDISNRPEIIEYGDGYYYGTGSVLKVVSTIQIDPMDADFGLWLSGVGPVNTNDVTVGSSRGVLRVGDTLIVEKVLYKRHWENGDAIIAVGRVLTGNYAGKHVNMREVRQRKFLKRVDDTSTNDADVVSQGPYLWGAGLKPGVPRP